MHAKPVAHLLPQAPQLNLSLEKSPRHTPLQTVGEAEGHWTVEVGVAATEVVWVIPPQLQALEYLEDLTAELDPHDAYAGMLVGLTVVGAPS